MTATRGASVSRRGLTAREMLALECAHQHRLLSTGQLHELVAPHLALRRVQRLLARLADTGLVAFVHQRGQRHRPTRLWHITAAGADVVLAAGTHAEPRRRVYTAAQAGGQLQHHTLAVNQTGLTFVGAARDRGDECGPLAWRHELAHPTTTKRTEAVIADAVLRYQTTTPARLEYRFLELDRATTPVDALAAKLARYDQLANHRLRGSDQPAWRAWYPTLPSVLIVLAGAPRSRLERRLRTLVALRPAMTNSVEIAAAACLLADLSDHGPFAPIFTDLDQPGHQTDWLGRPA